MCVAYSGRCVLSNYLAGRDANRAAAPIPAGGVISLTSRAAASFNGLKDVGFAPSAL